ncbi:MAG TPA: MarR family transcriptional regulator [Bacillales bacterium]|nr:MarR family transcriptional regulator [Bacillales bacterium]
MVDTFDRAVGYPTVLTGRKIVHLLYLNLRFYDITPEQWTILRFLGERDGITQKELSEASGKDQPTVTRILNIMDRKGWIRRHSNSGDRRSFLIRLTMEGRILLDELQPVVEETFSAVLDGISSEDLEMLKRVLRQMDANMENEFDKQKIK